MNRNISLKDIPADDNGATGLFKEKLSVALLVDVDWLANVGLTEFKVLILDGLLNMEGFGAGLLNMDGFELNEWMFVGLLFSVLFWELAFFFARALRRFSSMRWICSGVSSEFVLDIKTDGLDDIV